MKHRLLNLIYKKNYVNESEVWCTTTGFNGGKYAIFNRLFENIIRIVKNYNG